MNMERNIEIRDMSGRVIEYNFFTFSGGEEHIRLSEDVNGESIYITAKIKSSKDLVRLLMLNDAIRRGMPESVICYIPYFPYARQDRVCNDGEAHSLKVFANMINSCKFDLVEVADPHSDVVEAVVDNLAIIKQSTIFDMYIKGNLNMDKHVYTLVSPDAGATKKINNVAKAMECSYIVEASKVRDTATGNIIETKVNDSVVGCHCLIVDDICDGGRTFIELAKKLKEGGAKTVSLYVTHGIFSKGLTPLMEHIDHVYTTNTMCKLKSDNFLTVVVIDD
jgi:ribose-phosphate pyrophosphokinase